MDLSPTLFGHEGYRVQHTQTTVHVVICPKCGELQPTTLDYNDAVERLRSHAEMHDVVLPLKGHDWRGNPIG